MPVRTATLPGRYENPELIARGGMGEIYRAHDTVLDRVVAVKLLDDRFARDELIRKRFTREALAAARLSSQPSTVTIFDVGEADGRPFIVMEYVSGGSLHDVVKRAGAQPPARVLEWLEHAAEALDHAHEHGVVHRDVKTANLLIDDEGRLRVADFGVASARGLDSLTQTGTIIGTAGYLSPEQAQGSEATSASDCYALGVVAFELLAGTRPFASDNATAEATAHVQEPVPSLASRHAGLPVALDAVLRRAMAKDPSARYPTCGAFVDTLRDAFIDDAESTRIIDVPTAPRRRNVVVPLVLALILLAGILGAVLLTTRGDNPRTLRVTVTQQGTTVRETVTQPATPPPKTPTTSAASAAAQGFSKMRAGDYTGALPLLQQAAGALQGSGSLAEAYNDFNLAFTLAKTQGCSAQVLELLDASQKIQGHRKPIDDLRHVCKHARKA